MAGADRSKVERALAGGVGGAADPQRFSCTINTGKDGKGLIGGPGGSAPDGFVSVYTSAWPPMRPMAEARALPFGTHLLAQFTDGNFVVLGRWHHWDKNWDKFCDLVAPPAREEDMTMTAGEALEVIEGDISAPRVVVLRRLGFAIVPREPDEAMIERMAWAIVGDAWRLPDRTDLQRARAAWAAALAQEERNG